MLTFHHSAWETVSGGKVNAAGNTTLQRYDALGRPTETTDSLGQTTRQSWDAHERLSSATNAAGHTWRYSYDKAGRLIQETRPSGAATRYHYDSLGQLSERTDAAGQRTHYHYDLAGNLTGQEHRNASGALEQTTRYHYDSQDQLIGYEQTDAQGQGISSASYQRDALGRITASTSRYGNANAPTLTYTWGQSYNADGQLQSHTYPDGSSQTYSYEQGRLTHITLPNHSQISYGSYSWMVPQQISTPGATKTLRYDPLQRPTAIDIKATTAASATTTPLASRNYRYSATGNITHIDSELGATEYSYDKLNRLTQAQPEPALQALGLPQEHYSYDSAHNRTSSAHQPGAWSYDRDNQLTHYPQARNGQSLPTQVSYTPQGHTQKESHSQT